MFKKEPIKFPYAKYSAFKHKINILLSYNFNYKNLFKTYYKTIVIKNRSKRHKVIKFYNAVFLGIVSLYIKNTCFLRETYVK